MDCAHSINHLVIDNMYISHTLSSTHTHTQITHTQSTQTFDFYFLKLLFVLQGHVNPWSCFFEVAVVPYANTGDSCEDKNAFCTANSHPVLSPNHSKLVWPKSQCV